VGKTYWRPESAKRELVIQVWKRGVTFRLREVLPGDCPSGPDEEVIQRRPD